MYSKTKNNPKNNPKDFHYLLGYFPGYHPQLQHMCTYMCKYSTYMAMRAHAFRFATTCTTRNLAVHSQPPPPPPTAGRANLRTSFLGRRSTQSQCQVQPLVVCYHRSNKHANVTCSRAALRHARMIVHKARWRILFVQCTVLDSERTGSRAVEDRYSTGWREWLENAERYGTV